MNNHNPLNRLVRLKPEILTCNNGRGKGRVKYNWRVWLEGGLMYWEIFGVVGNHGKWTEFTEFGL